MAPMSCYIEHMARGQSGRLVVDVGPAFKRRLHAQLAAEGRTMKEWFLEQAERYLDHAIQQTFPWGASSSPSDRQPAGDEVKPRSDA